MTADRFLWYTPLGKLCEELLDLAKFRRFVITAYDPRAYEDGLNYYHSMEGEIWVRHRITADHQGLGNQIGVRHIVDQCYPQEVAHAILGCRNYGGRLPKELERYRGFGRTDRSRPSLARTERRSGEETATKRPRLWWDREDWTLAFDGEVFKQFEREAENQFFVLDAFQDMSWAPSVSFPRSERERVKSAVSSMNKWDDTRIRFSRKGPLVRWMAMK